MSKVSSITAKGWLLPIFFAPALLLGQNANAGTINFSDCGNGSACPYVTYGDANSYSLSLNALLWDQYQGGGTGPGNPFYVTSTAGAIKNDIVIATGASGTNVNTNFAGMDNAYPTPNDQGGKIFFTTNKTVYSLPDTHVSAPNDPTPNGFTGDTSDTWDTTLASLSTFLGAGNTPVFFFNNNQTNSGSTTDQDLGVWARIILTDSTGANSPMIFDLTNQNSAFTEPGGGVLNGDPTTYNSTGAAPIAGDNTHTDYVLSGGQICLDATYTQQACDGTQAYTVNNNLGANQAAYAIVVPELNNILLSANFGGYDALSLDLRMGCDPGTTGYPDTSSSSSCYGRSLNNGYEQVFLTSNVGVPTIPEPGTLALIGLGLVGMGLARRKKAH